MKSYVFGVEEYYSDYSDYYSDLMIKGKFHPLRRPTNLFNRLNDSYLF